MRKCIRMLGITLLCGCLGLELTACGGSDEAEAEAAALDFVQAVYQGKQEQAAAMLQVTADAEASDKTRELILEKLKQVSAVARLQAGAKDTLEDCSVVKVKQIGRVGTYEDVVLVVVRLNYADGSAPELGVKLIRSGSAWKVLL